MNFRILISCIILVGISCADKTQHNNQASRPEAIKIRIAELEIDTTYLDEYLAILKKEAAESVRLEKGVICIFPMYQEENPTQIRLLEIYENENAYQMHLQTSHFKHYKSTTMKMVKSLKLIDMEAIDKETMFRIFTKLEAY